jgi:hypothetical protein
MTLRTLCQQKSASKVVRKLNQLNIGLSNTVYGAWASKWSIGYHEPTIEDIQCLQKMLSSKDGDSSLLADGIDMKLSLQLDWSRHFGDVPTGPML